MSKRSNSDRQRERRERKARLGIKQINVEGTENVRFAVKEIAQRAKEEELYKIFQDLTWKTTPEAKRPKRKSQNEIDLENYMVRLASQLATLKGWRRSLIFWLID